MRGFFGVGFLVGAVMFFSFAAKAQLVSPFDLGMGVRPAGMGEAFTGLADDENALFYNPAALALLNKLSANTLYESHFGASDFASAALAGRSFGVGFLLFNFRTMDIRDEQDEKAGTFGYSNFGLMGALGMRGLPLLRLENLAFGLKLKFLSINTLEEGRGWGLALDPGLMLALGNLGPLSDVRLGLMLENLLSLGVRYANGRVERWRFGLRLGTSAVIAQRFKAALDFSPGGLHLGGELPIKTGFGDLFVRLGARGGLSLSLGLGLKFKNFRIDYAYIAHPQLTDSQRLSIAFEF